ncbi:MAG: polyribonucleotide nucleotidyltransferase, partial [Thermodesulfobacteriota bacterium]|nr:polyribonucleotide nucleotidyltransferase [Thermodesulfobacteriota bacterium]
GSFFRREIGRPSEREVVVCRLIDRPTRPLFPKGFKDEVQIIATVLSADEYCDPDVLAMTGASTALTISDIPFMGPIAGARVGYVDGNFVLNPSCGAVMDESSLNIVLAASKDAVVMVEGAADFLPESLVADAIEWGHENLKPLLAIQEELRAECGKPKIEFQPPEEDKELREMVAELALPDFEEALFVPEKMARQEAKRAVKTKVMDALSERMAETPERLALVPDVLKDMSREIVRKRIRENGTRIDGRDLTTVRPLGMEVGLLPRTHGSTLFARGETKVLAVATLGSTRDEQRMDSLQGEATKHFMLHYNFPPYCVGEARFLRGPSRRDIGHGNLAERAISPILPDSEEFPFTLRIVSEVMESNGSSSMATVCGASLALMDAGVPVKTAVAGIAMGLMEDNGEYFILTDILGDEDSLGDMDFKIAGSADGVTAIQMDIKISGIPSDVLRKALAQAREARTHILEQMNKVLSESRKEMSPYAPQLEILEVNPEKIRDVIGPGGKHVKAITAATGASIDIEDDGRIFVFAPNQEAMDKAREMVLYYDQTPELGKTYTGRVSKVVDCGAVVDILPGVDGLVHISQMHVDRIEKVTDMVKLGDEFKVKVVELEPGGRVRLSHKAVMLEEAGEIIDLADFGRQPARRPPRRDDRGPRRDNRRDAGRNAGRNDGRDNRREGRRSDGRGGPPRGGGRDGGGRR